MMLVNKDSIIKATTQLSETLVKKNSDYGNSVEKEFNCSGGASLILRLKDKLNRLENLIDSEEDMSVVDEALSDTFLDLAGYAILGHILTTKVVQEPSELELRIYNEVNNLFPGFKPKLLNKALSNVIEYYEKGGK